MCHCKPNQADKSCHCTSGKCNCGPKCACPHTKDAKHGNENGKHHGHDHEHNHKNGHNHNGHKHNGNK